jgi:RecA/RadA recombinase
MSERKTLKKQTFSNKDLLKDIKEDLSIGKIKYKHLPLIQPSVGFREAVNFNGYAQGEFHLIYGKPDVGKTTLVLELMRDCMKKDIIPVLINLEGKFNWGRLKLMNIDFEKNEEIDEQTGETHIRYDGDFIYVDGMYLIKNISDNPNLGYTTEDVLKFIDKLLEKQDSLAKKGYNLNYCFFIDSLGKMSPKSYLEGLISKKTGEGLASDSLHSNNMQKVQYNNNRLNILVNRIQTTKTTEMPFTNTLFGINQVMNATVMNTVVAKKKGGENLVYMATTSTFVGGKGSGEGKQAEFAIVRGNEYFIGNKVVVQVDKNHQENTGKDGAITSLGKGSVLNTAIGYIDASKDSITKFKKEYAYLFVEAGSPDYEDFINSETKTVIVSKGESVEVEDENEE